MLILISLTEPLGYNSFMEHS